MSGHASNHVRSNSDASARFRCIRLIVDKEGYAFGKLAGQPAWEDINTPMMKVFERTASAYSFKPGELESRRGKFPSIATGISYGGGQKACH